MNLVTLLLHGFVIFFVKNNMQDKKSRIFIGEFRATSSKIIHSCPTHEKRFGGGCEILVSISREGGRAVVF